MKSLVEKVTSGGSRLVRSSGNESPAGSQLFVINGTTITQRIEGSRTHIVKNFAREQQVGAEALLVQQQLHLLRFIACRPLVDFEIIVWGERNQARLHCGEVVGKYLARWDRQESWSGQGKKFSALQVKDRFLNERMSSVVCSPKGKQMDECKEYSYVYFKYWTSCLLWAIGKSTERAFCWCNWRRV